MVRPVLLYDADCGFCTRSAGLAPRLRLQVDVRPLQGCTPGELTVFGVDRDRGMREIPLVGESGRVVYGAAAIAAALRTGNVLWRAVGTVMMAPPCRWLSRAIYARVSAHRHQLPGGTDHCQLPS